MEINLEEFVSDYLAIESDKKSTARGIAEQYVDATADRILSKKEFSAAVQNLIPQIDYYLG